jgi:hypothetical protein
MKPKIVMVAIFIVGLVVLALGCSEGVSTEPSTSEETAVPENTALLEIRYAATIQSSTEFCTAKSGYTLLVFNLTITNDGYQEVEINPYDFYATVNNIKYDRYYCGMDSEFGIVNILDGGRFEGTEVFEVQDVVTTLGYEFGYKGYNNYNYKLIAEPTTPSLTPTPTIQKILIAYSSTVMTQIGTGDFPDRPSSGYVYLVVDMTIENQGYDSFSSNPFYFSVVINNVKYSTAFVTELENELQPVDVLNGGTVQGKLAFEVPTGTTTFSPIYEGFSNYNIQWVRGEVD